MSGGNKSNKNDIPPNWHNTGSNNEKIAALQSISQFRTTGKINLADIQRSHIRNPNINRQNMGTHIEINYRPSQSKQCKEVNNPMSPISTKASVDHESSHK